MNEPATVQILRDAAFLALERPTGAPRRVRTLIKVAGRQPSLTNRRLTVRQAAGALEAVLADVPAGGTEAARVRQWIAANAQNPDTGVFTLLLAAADRLDPSHALLPGR